MMVLPKINYLFSLIPNKLSTASCKSLDSSILSFLWKNKPARISLKTLQKAEGNGGLEQPTFYYYFLANRLQYASNFIKLSPVDTQWLDVEQAICREVKVSDLSFISTSIKRYNCLQI